MRAMRMVRASLSVRMWVRWLTCLTLLLAAPAILASNESAETVSLSLQVDNPRNFGYVVGDTLERRIKVNATRAVVFEGASLPKTGRQDPWLALLSAEVEPGPGVRARSHTFRLLYQLRNAPVELKRITLPALKLDFSDGPEAVQADVQEWSVTAGPITPADARADRTPLRPDRLPPPISTTSAWVALVACLGLASVILVYGIAVSALQRRNAPFARAYRAIRRASYGRQDQATRAGVYQESLRVIHRALDDTVGWRVFRVGLDEFLDEAPQFADLSDRMSRFLQLSRDEFFGGGVPPAQQDMQWLLAFCRECRARERRLS